MVSGLEDRLSRRRISPSFMLGATIFAMGGCGLAYEYSFSKIASDLLGDSTRQWAIVIAVMLFFMGVGADVQKRLSDRNLIDKLLYSEIAIGLLGGYGPLAMLYVYGEHTAYYTMLHYFLISSMGLLIGLEIPLIARINESYQNSLRLNLAGVLKMDYVGSLCGALLWIFLLPQLFSITQAAFALSFVSIAMAAAALFYFWKLVARRAQILATLIALLFTMTFSFFQAERWSVFAEQNLYRDRILLSETSRYQHVVITRSPSDQLSCYINGHLQFSSSDEFIYHEFLVHPAIALVPNAGRALVLGGGDGLAVRELLKYDQLEEIVLVDLDPFITDLAQSFEPLVKLNSGSLLDSRTKIVRNQAIVPSGEESLFVKNQRRRFDDTDHEIARVQVLNVDAVSFLEQVNGYFDVIVVDFPDPNALELAQLYSLRFYELLEERLAAEGVFIQQSTSPFHAKEAFLCIGRTIQAAGLATLPLHENVPSFGEWGWWIGGHNHRWSEERLRRSLEAVPRFEAKTRYLNTGVLQASLRFGKGQLATEQTDITTIVAPSVFNHYLRAWRGY